MSEGELLNVIEKAIRDVVNNPNLKVVGESKLMGDLGLESIDFLDISSELENSLGKEIDFKEVAEFAGKQENQPANMKIVKIQHLLNYLMATA